MTVTTAVLTTVAVDTDTDIDTDTGTDTEGEGDDKRAGEEGDEGPAVEELPNADELRLTLEGDALAVDEAEVEDGLLVAVGTAAAAPPKNGVGTTVELGLGGGSPRG